MKMKKCVAIDFDTSLAAGADDRSDAAHTHIALRPATLADRELLQAIYESTRIGEFLAAGFEAEKVRDLLSHQFAMQDQHYRRRYPLAHFDIVLSGVTPVGRLYHDWSGDEARVIDIALLPRHRGNGIGTRLMTMIVAEAARRAMGVTLNVETENPVKSLYRRLGFEKTGANGIYERMRRAAMRFDGHGVTMASLAATST
jgi:ribosomal protein S18 acetylase RimI-like enzyme